MQRKDIETGLHYNRFRYYDPDAGRFISHDPIGLLGGDNHFQYAPNPVAWVDVLGLAYFEYRPLDGFPWAVIGNELDDKYNTVIGHEQLFFEDGGYPDNIGYMSSSKVEVDSPRLLETYKTTTNRIYYDDCVMRKAASQATVGTYSLLGGWGKPKNNCQDWADRLREMYAKLIDDPSVRKECNL